MGSDEGRGRQSAWLWPAEWAVERAFWREVGTRTVAGVLTVLIVGVPTLLWGGLSGALQWQTVAPILVGIALFGGLAVLYVLVVVGIRRREREEIQTALEAREWSDSTMSAMVRKYGVSVTPEQRAQVLDAMMEENGEWVKSVVRRARRRARWRSRALFIGAIFIAINSVGFVLASLKLWGLIPQ